MIVLNNFRHSTAVFVATSFTAAVFFCLRRKRDTSYIPEVFQQVETKEESKIISRKISRKNESFKERDLFKSLPDKGFNFAYLKNLIFIPKEITSLEQNINNKKEARGDQIYMHEYVCNREIYIKIRDFCALLMIPSLILLNAFVLEKARLLPYKG